MIVDLFTLSSALVILVFIGSLYVLHRRNRPPRR